MTGDTSHPKPCQRSFAQKRSWIGKTIPSGRVGPDGPSIPSFTSFVRTTESRSILLKKILGHSISHQKPEEVSEEGKWTSRNVAFSPSSSFRQWWEVLIVICLFYNCFVFPPRMAFENNGFSMLFVMDAILDGIFFVDVVINLETGDVRFYFQKNTFLGFLQSGRIQKNRNDVQKHYLLSHFFIDLLSSLPYEAIYIISTRGKSKSLVFRYLRLSRMGRFFRMPRLLAMFSQWQDHLMLNSKSMRIFKLVFLIALFAHLNACMQFFVAEIEGFPSIGWVSTNDIRNASPFVQYSHALFRSLSHMLCIGYGAMAPITLAEIWVTIISMVVGASFYIVLFGILSALMLSLDRNGGLYDENMDSWQEYYRFCGMPKSLRRRITAYLKHKYHSRKMFNEDEMLNGLPSGLRTDVKMFLCDELISNVPLFRACRPVVVRALVSEMTRDTFCPGDHIFFRGEPADNLYFILDGTVQIETDDGTVLSTLSNGSHFGEFALLAYYKGDPTISRMANARSLSYSEIYVLSCHSFGQVADKFPEIVNLLESTAVSRSQANQSRIQK